MYDHPMNTLSFAESDELVDDQREVNRLLKKSMDEISVENRKKRASGENSVDAVLKELGFQLPEGEIRSCTTFFFHKHKLYFKYKHFLQHGMTVKYNNKLLTRQKQYNPVQLYVNMFQHVQYYTYVRSIFFKTFLTVRWILIYIFYIIFLYLVLPKSERVIDLLWGLLVYRR